jgi:hypothetical protein
VMGLLKEEERGGAEHYVDDHHGEHQQRYHTTRQTNSAGGLKTLLLGIGSSTCVYRARLMMSFDCPYLPRRISNVIYT